MAPFAALLAATTSAAVGFFFTMSEYENAVPELPQHADAEEADELNFELLSPELWLLFIPFDGGVLPMVHPNPFDLIANADMTLPT